jgi:hypothetical protein
MIRTVPYPAPNVQIKQATTTVKVSNDYVSQYLASSATDDALECGASTTPSSINYASILEVLVSVLGQLKDLISSHFEPEQAKVMLIELRADPQYILSLKVMQSTLRQGESDNSNKLAVYYFKLMHLILDIHAELQYLSEIDETSEEYGNALSKEMSPTPLSEARFVARADFMALFD